MKLLVVALGVLISLQSYATFEAHHTCTDDRTVTVSWKVEANTNKVGDLRVRSIGGNTDLDSSQSISRFEDAGSALTNEIADGVVKVDATQMIQNYGDERVYRGTLDIDVKLPKMQLQMEKRRVTCRVFADG